MITPNKFVEWEAGEKIKIENPKKFLSDKYNYKFSFGLDNLHKLGKYRENGWSYDMRKYLTLFVYNQYGNWYQAYAPNKTLLRKSIYGKIEKILIA